MSNRPLRLSPQIHRSQIGILIREIDLHTRRYGFSYFWIAAPACRRNYSKLTVSWYHSMSSTLPRNLHDRIFLNIRRLVRTRKKPSFIRQSHM